MKPITQQLEAAFRRAISDAFGVEADPLIALSGNEKFGDYQSNAAMGLAKQLAQRGERTNPRAVAERIKEKLDLGGMAAEVSIAGPGFINVKLSQGFVQGRLQEIAGDARLGVERVERPQTVVVDYSGPNIAKELHVGHLRSTIIGDAIARLLHYQGHKVIRQNHLGDWGTQFGMLIAQLRSKGQGADARIEDLESFYVQAKKRFDDDPPFQTEARQTVVRLQAGAEEERRLWKQIVDETRRHFQPLYERLQVQLRPEHERGESFYNPMLPAVVSDLKAAGIAVESEGAIVVPIEGYENPLIIEKTGGGYLYGTTDLAAIRFRVGELHARRIIYLTDSRQSQHFAQVFAAAKKAGWTNDSSLEHAPFGTMFGEDGKPFAARRGGNVKLKDLLDEAAERAYKLVTEKNPELPDGQREEIARAVGIGAMKYGDLSKDRTSDYVFSWDKVLAFDGNTAPYLQNAYVRVHGIFRKAKEKGIEVRRDAILKPEAPQELAIAKHILRFGEVVEVVARELKPHHLCNYLYELATRYHVFFENCPVLQSEEPVRSSRLLLSDLTARTLAQGLHLLGIAHPEQM